MAPFTPFFTEYIYQNLRKMLSTLPTNSESIHYLMQPTCCEELINECVEKRVRLMQQVIETGRKIRDQRNVPLKYPLPRVTVVSSSESTLVDIRSMEKYILAELNVKVLETTMDRSQFGISLEAVPDFKALGLRLRGQAKSVTQAIQKMSPEDIALYQADPLSFRIEGLSLEEGELSVRYNIKPQQFSTNEQINGEQVTGDEPNRLEVQSAGGDLIVILDMTPSREMMDEGIAREVINRIQKLRKKGKLVPTDEITVYYSTEGNESLDSVITRFMEMITSVTKSVLKPLPNSGWSDGGCGRAGISQGSAASHSDCPWKGPITYSFLVKS